MYKKPWKKFVKPEIVKIPRESIVLSAEQARIPAWFKKLDSCVDNGSPHIVIADSCAGSGKTSVILESIDVIPPDFQRLLYVVFMSKNRAEAQAKIHDSRVSVETWSSLSLKIVKRFWPVYIDQNANKFVEWDRAEMVCPGIPKQVKPVLAKLVSRLKCEFIAPSLEDIKTMQDSIGATCFGEFDSWNERIPEIASKMIEATKQQKQDNKYTFEDMTWLCVVMGWIKPQEFDGVLIDEAQDTNRIQFEFFQRMKPKFAGIVGDENQGMYNFRGALSDALQKFKDLPNVTDYRLSTTFRNAQVIAKEAQAYVPDFKAHVDNPEGELLNLNSESLKTTAKIGDSILARVNAPLLPFALGFLRVGIPARIEGKDIGADLIRIVQSLESNDVPSFMDKLEEWESAQIARSTGRNAEQRIEQVQDQKITLRTIAEVATDVQDIIDRINALFIDSAFAKKPAIVLSTVHKAKGLEWDRVFILCDTFKAKKEQTPAQAKEEKNIAYVARTRARLVMGYVRN